MLDTDVASSILRRRSHRLEERLRRIDPMHVCISVVTRAELRYGVAKAENAQRLSAQVELFLSGVSTVAWDDAAADNYGLIRAELERAGTPIGSQDTMIAAHAIATEATLVTNNVRHFERVVELRFENWDA